MFQKPTGTKLEIVDGNGKKTVYNLLTKYNFISIFDSNKGHLKTQPEIINGNRKQMTELADNSAHLAITPPSYLQLKGYVAETRAGPT